MTKPEMPKKENEINPEIIDTIDQCYAYFISRLEEILYAHKVVPEDRVKEALLQIVNKIQGLRAELMEGENK